MPCRDCGWTPQQEDMKKFSVLSQFIDFIGSQLNTRIYDYRGLAVNQPSLDHMTQAICDAIRNMTEDQKEITVYNGRISTGRRLGDWWEEHQTQDAVRASIEMAVAQMTPVERGGLIQEATWKLTEEEFQAIIYATKHGEV